MTKAEHKGIVKTFYDAAELLETGKENFCCHTLDRGVSPYNKSPMCYFINLFRYSAWDLDGHPPYAWAQERSEVPDQTEVRSRRVMLLLWAALMVESGEYERIFQ